MADISLDLNLLGGSSVLAEESATYTLTSNLSVTSSVTSNLLARYKALTNLSGNSQLASEISVSTGYPVLVKYLPPCRTVPSGVRVLDQVDFFLGDGRTRAQGITVSSLQLRVFYEGSQVDWPLVSGVGISNPRITAGRVYWEEFSAGFYNLRFFPNQLGSWRILLTYSSQDQAISLTYDVVQQFNHQISSGMKTSFIRR